MRCLDGEVILGVDTHAGTDAAVLLDLLGRPVALRSLARRCQQLNDEVHELDADLKHLTALARRGCSPKPASVSRTPPSC